jgi:hypothetical protein
MTKASSDVGPATWPTETVRIRWQKSLAGGFRNRARSLRCERGLSRRPVWLYMAKEQVSGTLVWLGDASRRPVPGDGGSPNGSPSARAELGDLGHIAHGPAEYLARREAARTPRSPRRSAANGRAQSDLVRKTELDSAATVVSGGSCV